MPVAILFPRYDHPAIEERYASWQSETILRRDAAEFQHYDFDESARQALVAIDAPHVLVVTDPLIVPTPGLAEGLASVLAGSGAFGAVPVTNEPQNARQRADIAPYMTIREVEIEASALTTRNDAADRVTWDNSDPGAFLCATSDIVNVATPLRNVLAGREVVISRRHFIHRWAAMRGQMRQDLLDRIAPTAKSVLDFGCGEGSLGAALKQRQKVRVVGIELDRHAAAIAKKRLDDVYQGDILEIISIIQEQFDWIVGGDIVEHLAEPWTFLSDLRRVARDDARLLLSLPNIANASIIADLLHGRFDYVYMGLTCVGHLRFFTRRSIEEMLSISGWEVEQIEAQQLAITREHQALIARLEAAGIPFSKDDLVPTGYYVTARKRTRSRR